MYVQEFVKNIQLFPVVFCVTIINFRTKISVAECSRGTLKTFTVVHHLFDILLSKIALLFSSVWLLLFSKRNLPGKLGQQSAIYWNSLGLCRDYDLNHNFFRIKLFQFSRQKAETFTICWKKKIMKSHKISTQSDDGQNKWKQKLSD